jgi:hypothetical protein
MVGAVDSWRRSGPTPLHVLKNQLAETNQIINDLNKLKLKSEKLKGDVETLESLSRQGAGEITDEERKTLSESPWTDKEERDLAHFMYLRQKIEDEITDRGH